MALYSTITRHRSYLRALQLAATYLKNPQHMRKLIARAQRKADNGSNLYLNRAREAIGVPVRMLKAYVAGDYREIPWRSLSMLTAAVIYFVMPFDFVTDLLPVFGFMDDIALLTWTASQLKKDIDRFLDWEQQSTPLPTADDAIIEGVVVDSRIDDAQKL
jgi:uncharacterized membrane protein YkvA (DUF1232 family)